MMINTPLLSLSEQYLKVREENHKQVLHFVLERPLAETFIRKKIFP